MRYEIKMAGTGGQGTVLLGALLAEAAATKPEFFISQTQAYDPAVRGGKAESTLVISDEKIDWPGPYRYDILLALCQEAYDRSIKQVKEDGLLIINSDLVTRVEWPKVVTATLTDIARSKFHDERVINILSAGVITGLCDFIPVKEVKKALANNFKGKALELNLLAFSEGINLATESLKNGFRQFEVQHSI
jgi:2-oxoglutarate ferredoxin oxidoreductase subunit gamma